MTELEPAPASVAGVSTQAAWWLRYQWAWLPADLTAGLLLTAIAIPEQMATARLVGVPATTGLISFAAGTLVFALFGRSNLVSIGADSTIAPIMAAAIIATGTSGGTAYSAAVFVLSMMTGALLLLAAPLRLGWLAVLLSVPVTTGFLAGIALRIIAGQGTAVFALPGASLSLLARQGDVMGLFVHPWPLAIALGVLFVSLLSERVSTLIPGALIAVAAAAATSWWFALPEHGVAVLGAIPFPVTAFHLPAADAGLAIRLLPDALIVALVCMIQTAAVLQSYGGAAPATASAGRDFAAVGGGSVLAGLLGGFAVNASPPRTAVVAESGGRTQAAGLIAIALTVLFILFARAALAYVPQAALAGVLIFIAIRIFRVRQMRQILRQSPSEFALVVVSALFVVVLPIYDGVTLSILLSFLHGIYVFARPACGELKRIPGTTIWWACENGGAGQREPGVLVFGFGAPLSFVNADYLVMRMEESIAAQASPCALAVIESSGIIDIDFTGSQCLQRAISALRTRGITVAVARMESPRAAAQAERTGLIAVIGHDHVFRSVEEAITALRPRAAAGPAH